VATPATLGAAALSAALAIAGCSAGGSPRGGLEISSRDGPLWVPSKDVPRYACSDGGIFVCDSAFGRISDRLCRCTPP